MKKSFTLIEMLVVISIIGLLAAVAAISYSTLNKNARDARRKADVEQIRSALEMYRSTNGAYPSVAPVDCSNSSVQSVITPYLAKPPADPQLTHNYYCNLSTGSTYTVSSYLENSAGGCGTGCPGTCTYTVGPYGQTCP